MKTFNRIAFGFLLFIVLSHQVCIPTPIFAPDEVSFVFLIFQASLKAAFLMAIPGSIITMMPKEYKGKFEIVHKKGIPFLFSTLFALFFL